MRRRLLIPPSPLDSQGKAALRFLGLSLLILSVGLLTVAVFLFRGDTDGAEKSVLIPRGTPLSRVADILTREEVIASPIFFRNALRLSQGFGKVEAGEFRFRVHMRPYDALKVLYFSEPITHQVTIPEGWSARQIGVLLEGQGLVKASRFVELAIETKPPARYRIEAPNLEGFLFPETYKFSKIDGEERIIDAMVQQFISAYDKNIRSEEKRLGMSMIQIVTLASIVEKETGSSAERELVSSVFHNRLKKGMRLQSDPTTIYGITDFNGNLTRADLRRYSPYNTYVIKGLPPGPIANPGLATLKATVKPAESKFLYFVSNNKGEHLFSETYEQHARKVSAYQR